MADPTQIHQVIMNLCTNAYQAMQESGGTLSVHLTHKQMTALDLRHQPDMKAGTYVVLEVSDTGPGMDQQTREKIFEPYFTTRKEHGGTGLGLAMVHGIVTNVGGSISVYSELGKGSNFRISLPATTQLTKTDLELVPGNHIDIPVGHEHLLVVDDEPALAELERQMLESLGYTVTAETSSQKALANFIGQPETFDLIVTDLTMPGMDGIEFARQIHKHRSDLPIILATGFSDISQKNQIKEVGICDVLEKPLLYEDLARSIRKALGGTTD
jgi:CheY-like chemotaxis protein